MSRIVFFIFLLTLFLGNILYVIVSIVLQKNNPITNAEPSLAISRQLSPPDEIPSDNNSDVPEENSITQEAVNPIESELHMEVKDDNITYEAEQESGILSNKKAANDTFFSLQYYLHELNVPQAWTKVRHENTVIVAVIDDGININHPDLTDNIWIEKGVDYGSNKIKDFVGDTVPDNFPTGRHGTMVAGIIGAKVDNNEGIAGIAKHVAIMPLRVFDFKGNARESAVIDAIYYAIHHKANIINLSLGQSQFSYSHEYDKALQIAYENGIVVIVAAGNGDILSLKNSGVNTTINPISPVCNNNGSTKYSIGLGSLNISGARARWSNYGSCVSFFAPGENIFSTSIAVFNKEYGVDYDTDSGTSFSAPMISGIVALGFNQFGRVSPDVVRESLNESLRVNKEGEYVIDASRYLDVLKQKQKSIDEYQGNSQLQNTYKEQALILKETLSRLSDSEYLAAMGYISKKKTTAGYNLSAYFTRQEAVEFAMKLSDTDISQSYVCRGIFADISSLIPDSSVCPLVENALKRGIITQEGGSYFRPRANVPLVEAVGMFLRASGVTIQQYTGGEFEPWQTNVIGTAFALGLVDPQFDFPPSKIASRRDIFAITRRIIEMAQ